MKYTSIFYSISSLPLSFNPGKGTIKKGVIPKRGIKYVATSTLEKQEESDYAYKKLYSFI